MRIFTGRGFKGFGRELPSRSAPVLPPIALPAASVPMEAEVHVKKQVKNIMKMFTPVTAATEVVETSTPKKTLVMRLPMSRAVQTPAPSVVLPIAENKAIEVPVSKETAVAINRGTPVTDTSGWSSQTFPVGTSTATAAADVVEETVSSTSGGTSASTMTTPAVKPPTPFWVKLAVGLAGVSTVYLIAKKLKK